jgi:hypothetical protein
MRTALSLLVLLALTACTKEAAPAPVAAPPAPSAVAVKLAAWDPVDVAFQGCAGGCGTRGEDPTAHLQPGAAIGELAYCPVSGVVFTVKENSPKADVNGKPVFFCCDSCAAHFTANRAAVLTARKL